MNGEVCLPVGHCAWNANYKLKLVLGIAIPNVDINVNAVPQAKNNVVIQCLGMIEVQQDVHAETLVVLPNPVPAVSSASNVSEGVSSGRSICNHVPTNHFTIVHEPVQKRVAKCGCISLMSVTKNIDCTCNDRDEDYNLSDL